MKSIGKKETNKSIYIIYICIHIFVLLCAKSFQSCPTLRSHGLLTCQDPLFMGFPRQEY